MAELIFPSDLGSNAKSLNYMGFQTFTITGGLGSAKGDRKYRMEGNPVYLPIPIEGVQDQAVNNWNQESVNFAQMTAGQAAGKNMDLGTSGGASELLINFGNKVTSNAAAAFKNLQEVTEDNSLGGLVKMSAARGMAQGGVGLLGKTIGSAAVQATGIAGLDETSIVYGGPQFRNFSFSFSLKPFSQMEQNTIEQIVQYFKDAANPAEIEGSLYRIYALPKVFGIKFFHKDGENTALPKIGKCALQNIGIKYGGDRFQTFAKGHAPIQTDITLQFIELVLQTHEHSGYVNRGAVDAGDMSGVGGGGISTSGQGHPGARGGGTTPAGVKLPANVPPGIQKEIQTDIDANRGRAMGTNAAMNRRTQARESRAQRDVNV